MNKEAAIKNIEKKLNVLRNVAKMQLEAADEALMELAELKDKQAPDEPRKRRNLKDKRVEDYAASVAAGTWRKPIELRKTPMKK